MRPPTAPAPVRALIVMPVATQRGGAELQLQQLIEQRALAGIEPVVAFLCDGPMVEWCRRSGVPALVIDAGRFRQARKLARTVRELVRLLREQRSEVVIGWMGKGQLYGGAAAAVAGVPSMWMQVQIASRSSAIDRLATMLPAKSIVTVSRTVDDSQRRLRPRRSTTVIYPGVDTTRFDAGRIGEQRDVRRRLGLPEDAPIFGSVGRLDRWKGFDVLLDAVPGVLERHPQATMVLVGGRHELDPAYADDLHDQAAGLGQNGRVRLVDQQPNPEEWMHAMDVFVHTSDNEPFGMVVIEAMALGKPVIASTAGGPTEVITPGVDGVLSPYGDHTALSSAIAGLLDDGDLRRRAGNAARRRAQDFSVEIFARQFGAAVAAAASGGC
jgi:glycosyltransferase involved in cell wall biosynthesis